MDLRPSSDSQPAFKRRFLWFSLAVIAIFLLLALRLWYLQVVSAERYQHLSERNRTRYVPVSAPRGPIYDRDGELLVGNRPSFAISVLRQEVQNREELVTRLAHYLAADPDDLQRKWVSGSRLPRFRPIPLAEDVTREELEQIQENSIQLPGVLAEVRPLRNYLYDEMAAHLFGYLGEINERELARDRDRFYRPGDSVGKSGMEKTLETYLRGTSGERRLEVDVLGKELRLLNTQEPIPGNRVYLTIRRDVQLAAEAAIGEHAGSAVLMDVHSGEILALASRPSFNPADFARGISGQEWISLLENPRHPLKNKAIQGQYPPGSTYKIVTALAALRAGIANASTTVFCSGKFTLGNRDFRCWKRGGHGRVDLRKALKESCDVWFYQVSLDLGIDRLGQMSFDLGLGRPLGISLDGELGGLVPTRQWKRERFNEPWYNGETVNASIGQGYLLTTPLQLAVMTAAVANGGNVLRPQLLQRVEDLDGKVLMETKPETIRSTPLNPADLKAVREALVASVDEQGGTGRRSQLPGISVAGKTGTAQVVRLGEDRDAKREIPYRFRDHALFVAYAPADDPQVAVAVVIEHGTGGGAVAAPIARMILENYFGLAPQEQLAIVPTLPTATGD
jgi:penicillin-binding protein 2